MTMGTSRPEDRLVLVVEDEEDVRNYLGALLEDAGFQVVMAASGDEALDVVEKTPPDLTSLDLVMPGKSGTRFLNEIRRDETLREIPIVVQSGARQATGVDMRHYLDNQPFREKKEQAVGASPDTRPQAFLEKPVSPTDLLETIGKLI